MTASGVKLVMDESVKNDALQELRAAGLDEHEAESVLQAVLNTAIPAGLPFEERMKYAFKSVNDSRVAKEMARLGLHLG